MLAITLSFAATTESINIRTFCYPGSKLNGPLNEAAASLHANFLRQEPENHFVPLTLWSVHIAYIEHIKGLKKAHHVLVEKWESSLLPVIGYYAVIPTEIPSPDSFSLHF